MVKEGQKVFMVCTFEGIMFAYDFFALTKMPEGGFESVFVTGIYWVVRFCVLR